MPTESWKLSHLWNRKPALNGSFSFLVFWRAGFYLCELRIFLRCSFCSLGWLLLENLPALLGFSLITPTLLCFCFGSDSWCGVLFEGRATVAVSAESELIRIVFCLRDVICFFVGPTEDQYFEAIELLLNISLTHCWMSTVLSFDVWFWFLSYDLFGPFLLVGRDCLFSQVAWFFKIVRVMVNACIIWPNEEYFSQMFWLNSCVTWSRNWFCKKCLLHQWVYVTACMLFWHWWFNWSLTIFSNFFLPGFWSFAVPCRWKSSGGAIFFLCVFCGNVYCLTNWTKLFWYCFVTQKVWIAIWISP